MKAILAWTAVLVSLSGQGATPLAVVVDTSGPEKRLVITRSKESLGSIAVPARVSAASLEGGLKSPLWHPDGTDVAVAFQSQSGSFVVIFLRQANGTYRAVDVSEVERRNIGAIGPDRTYRDVQTTPTAWLPDRSADAVQLWFQTRAWDLSGQRYVGREPLIVTRDGRPLWR